MDFVGLTTRYKINRPLSEEEIDRHLLQAEASSSEPWYQLSVIRMNSTYLECVDKFFVTKGFMSAVMIALVGILIFVLWVCTLVIFDKRPDTPDAIKWFTLFMYTFFIAGIYITFKFFLLKECFTYTHFPIRFNRKTRKVHVFRQNGTIMTEDWEKLYFTLCPCGDTEWEVRGHRLAEDEKTVLETFALPFQQQINCYTRSQWEFVRCYMECPDELPALANQVEHVMDVADRREGYWRGFVRLYQDLGIVGILLFFVFIPLELVYALGRWIATHTSKIPRWPAEIEAECQFEPNDPCLRDAKHLAKPNPLAQARRK